MIFAGGNGYTYCVYIGSLEYENNNWFFFNINFYLYSWYSILLILRFFNNNKSL